MKEKDDSFNESNRAMVTEGEENEMKRVRVRREANRTYDMLLRHGSHKR